MTLDALSPRAQEIVATARDLLEHEGPRALSMRRVAERLGIRAPSLYKHLPDKQALENALISIAFAELAEVSEAALEDDDPLAALACAYRRYAKAHPHLYRLMTDRRLHRNLLKPGAEERARRPALRVLGGDPDAARALWGFAHGMTILELDGRFPADADLDAAWQSGLAEFREHHAGRP